jgi:beta-ureidopropionase / N-carbamoyl-L-amino-acid hydrolase
MLAVDEDRVIADLRALAEFGKAGNGVNRPALSEADLSARQWLLRQMQTAGLETTIDGICSVYGRSSAAQSILVGSHSDSVPYGGWLDGALGVIFALEVARASRASGSPFGVDVVSFADEEGTWLACLGSRVFCGELAESRLADLQSKSGERLSDRLQQLGLRGRPLARLDPQRHCAYLEAHIEQGPRLEAEGIDVGIVTAIVGMRRHVVRFTGRADHAGTTPMAMRRDAAMAMFRFATSLAEAFGAAGGADAVWNFGVVTVRPGAGNVVPAEAELMVEFRNPSPVLLDRMETAFYAAVQAADDAQGVSTSSTPNVSLKGAPMNPDLVDMLVAAAAETGASHVLMPSGAGHDAMILASHIPAAMLFVPSIGGRSHDISENTNEADIRRGFRVFAAGAAKIIERLSRAGAAPAAVSKRQQERTS